MCVCARVCVCVCVGVRMPPLPSYAASCNWLSLWSVVVLIWAGEGSELHQFTNYKLKVVLSLLEYLFSDEGHLHGTLKDHNVIFTLCLTLYDLCRLQKRHT